MLCLWTFCHVSFPLFFFFFLTEENSSASSSFMFFSSFQSNLLAEGLGNQVGWGHVWNRFSGPLSCRNQSNQCALTPLVPPAWWDGLWQSPTPRDIHKMEAFGVLLSGLGTVDDDDNHLRSFCALKKKVAVTVTIIWRLELYLLILQYHDVRLS